MDLIELGQRAARDAAEADPTVTLMLVYPEERLDLDDIVREHGDVEIVHEQGSPVDEALLVHVRCRDEWEVEGLERAWRSYRVFRRMLPPHRGRRGR